METLALQTLPFLCRLAGLYVRQQAAATPRLSETWQVFAFRKESRSSMIVDWLWGVPAPPQTLYLGSQIFSCPRHRTAIHICGIAHFLPTVCFS